MITELKVFEAYLNGSDAPLYHSTSIFFASQILDSDSIIGPVSLTRDKNYIIDEHPVTFVLDKNKLKQNYKIVPFNYLHAIKRDDPRKFSATYNNFEYEEVVKTDIKNLHKYLTEVRFNDSISQYKNMKYGTREEFREAYDDLMNSLKNYSEIHNNLKISENKQENNNDTKVITLYHGTASTFDDFDINKTGTMQYSDWGKGIYFTRSKSNADYYRVEAVKKNSKEYNDAFEEYEQSERDFKNAKYGTDEYNELYKLTNVLLKKFQETGKSLNSTKEGRIIVATIKPGAKIYKYNSSSGMTDPYLADNAKAKGYDIVLVDENKYMEEYVVMNPDAIIITGDIKL